MSKGSGVSFKWLLLMAWRDSRKNRSRLLLFIASIVMGIAALVAITALGENVRHDIDAQAATLLGADLELSSGKPISDSALQLVAANSVELSEERAFASMVYFSKIGGTRLVQVKALQGNFPYYGALETDPVSGAQKFRDHRGALVDKTLMLQYNAHVGDSIRVGELSFVIDGMLLKVPGTTGLATTVAPSVYIPLQYFEATGLLQKGSRISYRNYYKLKPNADADQLVKQFEPVFDKEGVRHETIQSQKADSTRSFNDISSFLSLVGFIALLLGCIGVASSIHIYVKEKVSTIAILRCLGLKSVHAFLVYLIQIMLIGFVGAVIGAVLGTIIQQFLPIVLQDFVTATVSTAISWKAITQGVLLGTGIAVLFALLPLLSLRKISPLNTLRIQTEEPTFKDPLRWLVYGLIFLFVLAFSYIQLGGWVQSFAFTAGIIIALLLLVGVARLLMWLVKRFFPANSSYLLRQGLANLFRPNNQTTILIVSIGLGTAFICTLISVQSLLLNRISLSASDNQPDMVLFDIQTEQQAAVAALVQQQDLPVLQQVPIVNMRLEEVKRMHGNEFSNDSNLQRRLLSREYRVTYQHALTASEKLVKGTWQDTVKPGETIQISLADDWADNVHLDIGDTMVFNVQGARLSTVVGSYREVDWRRIQTNFLIVFPTGVLEEAPQFNVLLTHVGTDSASAAVQQKVVRQFPNVSIIDLGLVLKTLDELLRKIAFVIKFMAAFSILTGIIVLIASVLTSKYHRIQESVLLRTLGANRRQILYITGIEYLFLGALASLTGILLSIAGTWALAVFTFKVSFSMQVLPVLIVFVLICFVTLAIGLLNVRSILNCTPLEVLRKNE